MAGNETPGAGDPRPPASEPELLREMRELRRQARAARHAYWFPLVLFGVLTCASIPLYHGPAVLGQGAVVTASRIPALWPFLSGDSPLVSAFLGYYWLVALLGGLLLTLVWYRWHARRTGLQTPARGYLITTAALTLAAIAIPPLALLRGPSWLRFLHRLAVLWPGDLTVRGTVPFLIIAAGLLVLAWAERSRALAVIAVLYTGAALLASLYDVENLTARFGWNPPLGEQSLPNLLLPAVVLLVAGAGAFVVQRHHWATG
jgi:hypothetical protein